VHLSVQVNTDPAKQRIYGALQLTDHRSDPPSLDQPLPCTRFPDTTGLSHQFIVLPRTQHHHPSHTERPEHNRADA